MKQVLLVGLGSEIGATLLSLNNPEDTGIEITVAVTHKIPVDEKNPHLDPLDSILARVVLADPTMLDQVQVDTQDNSITVCGRKTRIVWGDAREIDPASIGQKFHTCIVATSKNHIGDPEFMNRWRSVAEWVVGVAEAPTLPAIYAHLVDAPTQWLPNKPRRIGSDRVFSLGSCQSNGWHAVLRGLLELAAISDLRRFEMRGMEVDIVHPDTPTGRLGTRSIEPRDQDPRDNLRPSFSQIKGSMELLFPTVHSVNSVSLRTFVTPPGYQISRFFFTYAGAKRFSQDNIDTSFRRTAAIAPLALRVTSKPLGSRAYAHTQAAAVVLSTPKYLIFRDDPFKLITDPISELLVQSFVHNVRGYCRSVLSVVSQLADDKINAAFYPS